jgi:outer membrane protein assembly factor BamA
MRSGPAGNGGASYSTVGSLSLFKSLDLPGFAHHVIALHGSAGYADERAAGYYSVGGVSGGTIQLIPGYVIGEGAQTFPVRGFVPGTLIGTRALSASAEYRAPLWMIGNAPGLLPLFFDRTSITFFGDYGSAWCPDVQAGREVCNTSTDPNLTRRLTIGSAGAELNVNAAPLTWDSPYRFRLGVAIPTQNAAFFGRTGAQVYFVTGIGF